MKSISMNQAEYIFYSLTGYEFTYYADVDFFIFNGIRNLRQKGRKGRRYNDVVIMLDTETSKKPGGTHDNHVVAWSITFACGDIPFLTAWGNRPSECIYFITQLKEYLHVGEVYIYIHNLPYDWVFLRKFMFKEWGTPEHQLNVKPHYPIYIQFENGIILRDSLILAQRKLERWADDLEVKHKKAVGKWDYNKLRNQSDCLSDDELKYIECDTLAGVECLIATRNTLNKDIYAMPYTATGIPREESRKRGKQHHAHDHFLKIVPDYETQIMLEAVFHGGYTHANRYFVGDVINEGYFDD